LPPQALPNPDLPSCRLSIVIVNYDGGDLLRECVTNLHPVAPPGSEVIVVDNGSSDRSVEWLLEAHIAADHIVHLPDNVGFAGGCNAGIARARGEYVLLLNTDAFPEPGSLEVLIDFLKRHPEAGIAGPQLLYPGGRWQYSAGPILGPRSAMMSAIGVTPLRHLVARASWRLFSQHWRSEPVEFVAGACMLLRRTMIESIGPLDADYFFFAEDVEYCHRANLQGWAVVFVPQSRVIHLRGGSSSRKTPVGTMELQRNAVYEFITKTYGQAYWKQYAFWIRFGLCWRGAIATIMGNEARREVYTAGRRLYSDNAPR
jgi:N-acetylglucosaminyl-diphospho-decaprenol L-rhamnosyltransferase